VKISLLVVIAQQVAFAFCTLGGLTYGLASLALVGSFTDPCLRAIIVRTAQHASPGALMGALNSLTTLASVSLNRNVPASLRYYFEQAVAGPSFGYIFHLSINVIDPPFVGLVYLVGAFFNLSALVSFVIVFPRVQARYEAGILPSRVASATQVSIDASPMNSAVY
jgi:hypothetical protein